MKKSKIKVVELFAGVGGFRLGLEGWKGKSATSNYKESLDHSYDVVWSNQFEPTTKIQHANLVYKNNWPDSNHSEDSIEEVIEKDFDAIPDHDLLVGGFPCQDYSVATTLKRSGGLEGKKGVLWWSIYNILKLKNEKKPKYLFLENVDRLLTSPVKQRGRDFAVMLSCLYELGYAVEWRVINAAEYGMPQRRRRIYLVCYHQSTELYKKLEKIELSEVVLKKGILMKSFPIVQKEDFNLNGRILKNKAKVSKEFNKNSKDRKFFDAGFMIRGKYYSTKSKPIYEGSYIVLKNIIHKSKNIIPEEFFINETKPIADVTNKKQRNGEVIQIKTEWDVWKYLKGTKREWRYNKAEGFTYKWGEGKMIFPDKQTKPARTIITGEGGTAPSRFKHVIKQFNRYRRLTPVELERLNMFPDNHTKLDGITNTKRAFFMGNALVIGIVERIGIQFAEEIKSNQD